jgi:hypothetical protein
VGQEVGSPSTSCACTSIYGRFYGEGQSYKKGDGEVQHDTVYNPEEKEKAAFIS